MFSNLRNILAIIDCSTKNANTRLLDTSVSKFVGQNRFFYFVSETHDQKWEFMAKVEIRIRFAGQRRCGSHYSGFFSRWQIFILPCTLFFGFSVFADGDEHEACHDDTLACFRNGFLSSEDKPWTCKICVLIFFKSGRPQTGQVRRNRLCMTAPPNNSSLDRNTVLYIVALREQLSGNSLSFCKASVKFLSSFCEASVKLLSSFCQASVKFLSSFCEDSVKVLLSFCQASVQLSK